MKTRLLFFLLLCCAPILALAQAPANDNYADAVILNNLTSYCSDDAAYSSIGATTSIDNYKDVWFKFTAIAFDVSITATGDGTSPLVSPGIDIYTITGTSYANIVGSAANGTTTTTYYKGALTIGQTYYVRVYGRNNNTGVFKLCVNNYNPVLAAGQDYITASVLCSKASFTQTGVTGAGLNNREAAGTCLDVGTSGSIEANTAWYKWTAANNGTLTFTITPTVVAPVADDIDWVLYDLGTTGDAANVNSANAIRCDASRGVDCVAPDPIYYKTGIRDNEPHTTEQAGCSLTNDGFDETITMVQGHVYGLLINNFSNGNNGFNLDFGGTGTFVGPTARLNVSASTPCTAGQVFTFTNSSTNYTALNWTFGEGATPATATGNGPFFVTYATLGNKTAVLQASGGQGCTIVADTTFAVGITPPKPKIDTTRQIYCLLDTLLLATPVVDGYTYKWSGPNNFTSTDSIVKIPIVAYSQAGTYILKVTQYGCTSDTAQVTLISIGKKPIDNFTITAANLCTPKQSFTIINQSKNYTALQWNYGLGANAPTQVNDSTVTVTYSTYGQKTITLTATGDKGCVTILSQTLTVPLKPATPVINGDTAKVCIGGNLTLSTPAQANTGYMWAGPNGFTGNTATVTVPATGTNVAGVYSLSITQGLCTSDAATVTIDTSQIIPIPIAAFTAMPVIPSATTLAVPTTVVFTNTSTKADSYLWSFGDGNTSTNKNPVYTYQTKGNFTVSLTATSKGLCSNTVTKGKLILRYDVSIFIPNTFTPNSDGVNDLFDIKITHIKTYHLQIFNRYGAKLFEAYDINTQWNGLYNNKAVPVGTYYYLVNILTLNDDNLKESGDVTVIR